MNVLVKRETLLLLLPVACMMYDVTYCADLLLLVHIIKVSSFKVSAPAPLIHIGEHTHPCDSLKAYQVSTDNPVMYVDGWETVDRSREF